ncbi:MAG TPA: N-acetyltransferase [Thermoanaerobaculia bacterium]|nr:N-acetyltransferase [Thermoanaerobaculia bacterium]
MSGAVSVERLGRSKKELHRFFDVADRVYAGDPNWVAPIRDDLAKVFALDNPFFRHAEMQLFLARRDGVDVGRVAAILDRSHNEFQGEKTAFVGYFESVDDPAVAAVLFDAAALWARERKMRVLRGPANPSLNDEAGLLVDGFGSPPILMMTYNPRYYPALYEGYGFRKAKDLLAFWFEIGPKPLERFTRVNARLRREEKNFRMLRISKKSLKKDLPLVREVYNAAWEKNWGFVPMTSEEMDFMAARLKPLLDPDFALLGVYDRPDGSVEPVAFMMTLPDYNVAMAPLKGRLLPFGWLKFLLGMRRIRTVRVLTLGVKKEYRSRGLQSLLFEQSLRAAMEHGYTGCEVSWLLEDNDLMIRGMRVWGGRLYKTYRMYDKDLVPEAAAVQRS